MLPVLLLILLILDKIDIAQIRTSMIIKNKRTIKPLSHGFNINNPEILEIIFD